MTATLDRIATTVTARRPFDAALALAPARRGPYDPCFHAAADGSIWRTSRQPSGPVTFRITQVDARTARCDAWGPGAPDLVDAVPALLGIHDDATAFAPSHPVLAEAHRRHPDLRIGRTNRVLEALVPAVLEQRVHSVAAYASWRRLVTRFGEVAPGPAPQGMRVSPAAETWRRIPSWEFHRANVDPARSRTIVRCAGVADSLERLVDVPPDEAARRLRSVSGIGVWTAAEVAQRALGDADALSVGDYNLAAIVGWSLTGRPMDDEEMVAYLEPMRPHRYRAVRLLMLSGRAVKPKFGPRTPVTDHRWH
ncbi:DNA-3-methyladenine glycosylase 2 family protein [Rhodococcus triatomae]|uniref:DNA-3-methyladenine glycosylase II n=1 Tax=Rhodococcus triatomae TaxID=300028 RepID=A0A1G8GG09_9NOCA|nr:DNA-3-methyladenine glycosylase [Rhodococcus triatomae]QNG20391.1 DNA-3-methyladenine glycosylase 2 family protein [Rhodococcus triatomae]QNG23693.1 DNA-3-methyladenine glycosylase 2 family protein [Rhodococcus triatomae]SDH93308.1 3-methyladenine DNA glycosylase/8-oxoguanine DNA glycosylase [Rhodococcus triatomae]